jgi:hypothetical protein
MNDLHQCDDFFIPVFIPAFLLKLPPHPETNGGDTQVGDFLKNVQGWTDILPLDECE